MVMWPAVLLPKLKAENSQRRSAGAPSELNTYRLQEIELLSWEVMTVGQQCFQRCHSIETLPRQNLKNCQIL